MSIQISNTQEEQFERDKDGARTFGGAVYVGGVIAATVLFITFVLTAFPQDAYFTRLVMGLAGVAVGCSMLAFPYALHKWAVSKSHRWWTTLLYYGEMVFIGINTIVSFVNLLAKYTGFTAPEWAVLYEPFSVLSIIYVIFAWGTVFLKDPQSRIIAQQREFDEKYNQKIAAKTLQFLDTPQGEDAIIVAASEDIKQRISRRTTRGQFGTTNQVVVEPGRGFVQHELTTEQPRTSLPDDSIERAGRPEPPFRP